MKASEAEKAMVKNSAVSTEDPMTLEITGACHHVAARIRSKIATSRSCAVRKAMPDPTAIRSVTSGPNSPMIWVPISEQATPTRNPAKTTRRAACTP